MVFHTYEFTRCYTIPINQPKEENKQMDLSSILKTKLWTTILSQDEFWIPKDVWNNVLNKTYQVSKCSGNQPDIQAIISSVSQDGISINQLPDEYKKSIVDFTWSKTKYICNIMALTALFNNSYKDADMWTDLVQNEDKRREWFNSLPLIKALQETPNPYLCSTVYKPINPVIQEMCNTPFCPRPAKMVRTYKIDGTIHSRTFLCSFDSRAILKKDIESGYSVKYRNCKKEYAAYQLKTVKPNLGETCNIIQCHEKAISYTPERNRLCRKHLLQHLRDIQGICINLKLKQFPSN